MQISTSLQNTFMPTPTAELSKTSPTVSTDTTPQKTDSINKSAYNYFDLGEDISQYTQTDPVQEKTNQELVTYLGGIMNDTTAEGKKNLKAFDTHLYGSILSVDNMTKEEFQKLEVNLMAEKYKTSSQQDPISFDRPYSVHGIDGEYIKGMNMAEMKDFLGEDYAKNAVLDLKSLIEETGIFHISFNERQKQYPHEMGEPIRKPTIDDATYAADGYRLISIEESNKLSVERFKNLYSFSDEFSKTDKFQELYDKYQVKFGEKMDELYDPNKRIYEIVGEKAFLTAEVAKQGFSKSEAIDYYSNVSKELTDRLSWSGYDKTAVFQDMKESIKLYDKITADLKEMWGYGDLNVRA